MAAARIAAGRCDRVSEESYFFKLSEFEKPLLELYERRPRIHPPPTSAVMKWLSFVKAGLEDFPCRGPRSRGACRCRTTPLT